MAAVTIILGLVIAGLVYAYFRLIYRKPRPGEPPLVPGSFLWGNGNQFMQHAVKFLNKCRDTHGDVFTLRLLNQYVTVVLDIHSYELVSREKNFEFEPIQQQVSTNVFAVDLNHGKKMMSMAGQKVNGKYLFMALENFSRSLTDAFSNVASQIGNTNYKGNMTIRNNMKNTEIVQKTIYDQELDNRLESIAETNKEALFSLNSGKIWEPPTAPRNYSFSDSWKEDKLRHFASTIMFSPIFYSIFGRDEIDKDDHDKDVSFHPEVFHKQFDEFHKYFNYLWLGVPIKFFPKAVEAFQELSKQPSSFDLLRRDGCSEYIKFATQYMLNVNHSERDVKCHNLVFLHINYNAFRIAYWCMYKLMEDGKVMDAVRGEVAEVVEAKRTGADESEYEAEFTTEDINKLPIVDSFLKEVIRTTSGVFMVRGCTKDTKFTTAAGQIFNIRKGDRVAMYPPVFHHDPDIFKDPETFKYDRFVDAVFYKNGVKVTHPLIGFGSLCPGQKLAMLELKWFIINVVHSFKFELLEGERTAPNTKMYGQEILPPIRDVHCRYLQREGACALKYLNTYGSNGSKGLDGISSGNML